MKIPPREGWSTLRVIRVACHAQGKDSAIRKTEVNLQRDKFPRLSADASAPRALGRLATALFEAP